MLRPGKYIEYDFPLHEVNRLAVKEAEALRRHKDAVKKYMHHIHQWWARPRGAASPGAAR